MIVYKTNDNKRVLKLSKQDQKIIMLIYFGVDSCTTIARLMKVTKPAIVQKVNKLELERFVEIRPVYGEKHIQSIYVITPRGKRFIEREIWRERLVA